MRATILIRRFLLEKITFTYKGIKIIIGKGMINVQRFRGQKDWNLKQFQAAAESEMHKGIEEHDIEEYKGLG